MIISLNVSPFCGSSAWITHPCTFRARSYLDTPSAFGLHEIYIAYSRVDLPALWCFPPPPLYRCGLAIPTREGSARFDKWLTPLVHLNTANIRRLFEPCKFLCDFY